jgi:hypothetical protein
MLKQETKKYMLYAQSPINLWCYCIERRAKIINSVVSNNFRVQGQTPHSKMTGQPCDISDICEFAWFEWCLYHIEGRSYPYPSERLSRVLGPASHQGNAISQHVLIETMNVLPLQTLRCLTPSELSQEPLLKKMRAIDASIKKKFGDSMTPPSTPAADDLLYEPYADSDGKTESSIEIDDVPDYDLYINSEVLLP